MAICLFLIIAYLLSSIQFKQIMPKYYDKIQMSKKYNKHLSFYVKKIKNKITFENTGTVLDGIKCVFFVLLSSFIFDKKNIVDITAIVAHLGHSFPIWYKFRNKSKNFINVILTGFVLDPITGISMIVGFLFAAYKSKYSSVAITSAMLVGIIKTFVHLLFFSKNNYFDVLFFIMFGIIAISRNKNTLLYICEKSIDNDIFSVKKKSKKNEKSKNLKIKDLKKNKSIKKNITTKITNIKGKFYRNYKNFYNNNFLYEKENRNYK